MANWKFSFICSREDEGRQQTMLKHFFQSTTDYIPDANNPPTATITRISNITYCILHQHICFKLKNGKPQNCIISFNNNISYLLTS
jgi:hypothetical protein